MMPPLDPPDEPDTDDQGRLLDCDGEPRCCPHCGDYLYADRPREHRRCYQIDREEP